jgi:outer membrane receptor protein involved in Fe transport
VDVFTLDASVVFDSEGDPNESAVPQFFEYWPEYSRFGDHVDAAASWLISDNLSIVGETVYALEPDTFARGSIGAELRHSPLLVTYVEYRVIDASETELLGVGWTYQVTPKYRVALSPQYDFREEDFRALNARITRSFPDFDFTLQVRYDQIRDDTSVGASLSVVEF